MRTLSSPLRRAIYAQESGEVLLTLVKLTHDDWENSLRLVRNGEAVVHDGQTYSPCGFTMSLPDDEDGGLPVVRWVIDGVDREVVIRLRSAISGPIEMRVRWVLASQPEVVDVEFAGLEIRSADYDAATVSGVATIEPILDEPVSRMRFTPQTAPGLF